jgi:arabinofuranan 3-O-arabinosyltransferase
VTAAPGPAFRLRPRTAIAAAAWTVLLLALLINSAGLFVIDIKPEIYFAPARSASLFSGAWQPSPQLGFPNFNVGLVPVAWLVALIQHLGVAGDMSVRVLRLVLYTVAAAGAAQLSRAVARRGMHPVIPLVAAIAYVANPYAVVGASTLATLLPYALLPWQTFCLIRALESRRSWTWPAGFALCFAAMSGMNAGVVPLLQLVSVPVVVLVIKARDGLRWRRVLGVVARTAVLVSLVSLYWIVPSLFALSEGQSVLDNSETLAGINSSSSFAEVLRGLGFWPMYGSGTDGPWLPGFTTYLTTPIVVVTSFGMLLVLAGSMLYSRGPVRRLGLALSVTAAVFMVGAFPFGDPAPVGRALRWLFEHVSGFGAFRTTNKVGAVLVLSVALLAEAAAPSLAARLRSVPARAGVVVVVLAFAVGGVWPAMSGGLYPRSYDIPAYWSSAARHIDAHGSNSRVWLVPGTTQPQYRWTAAAPDDLALPLFSRPTVVRTTLPVASPYAANLLAAVDTGLQEGTLPPGTLSSIAKYLGVGDVVVRNDMVWEADQGARPWAVHDQVSRDTGLTLTRSFGAPGDNVVSPLVPAQPPAEAALPPVQDYRVDGDAGLVRAESLRGLVVVDGDGFAFGPLQSAGLLSTHPAVRLAGDLTPVEFSTLLGPDKRLVVTDTNRRRTTILGRLAGNQGPLLAAGDDPGSTRALFTPTDQTVLTVEGGAHVSASQEGSSFGPLAEAAPENAFDGDPTTSWQFGDFGTAVGQSLTARLDTPRHVGALTIQQAAIGPVRVDRVTVMFGGRTVQAPLSATGVTSVPLDATGRLLRIKIDSTMGDGFNRLGIAEVGLGGLRLTRVARMPETVSRLSGQLDGTGQARLQSTPLDVVMNRVRGTDTTAADDEETSLQRDFELPDARSFRTYGLIRPGRDVSDETYDQLAGSAGDVVVSSTSRALDLPEFRGSMAVDGDPETAWVPDEPVVGDSLTVQAPAQRVNHVDVVQQPGPAFGRLDAWATRVAVRLDGVTVATAATRPGRTRIDFPPTTASRLTIEVLARNLPGQAVRISEVKWGHAQLHYSAARAATACVTVATIDGVALRMHPLSPPTTLDPSIFGACPGQQPLTLGKGTHHLRSDGTWAADTLVLRDQRGEQVVAPGPVPDLAVTTTHGSGLRVTAAASAQPWILVTGQSHDPAWAASSHGQDLGTPLVGDGYSTAWQLSAGGRQVIDVHFGPQRPSDIAAAVSGLAIAGCLFLLLLGGRRRWRNGPPPPSPAPQRPTDRPRQRWRPAAVAVAAVVGADLTANLWGLAVAAVLVALVVLGRFGGRDVLRVAVAAAVLTPVMWLLDNLSRLGLVTADLVSGAPWAQHCAVASLVAVVVGVLADERLLPVRRPSQRATRSGPPVGD